MTSRRAHRRLRRRFALVVGACLCAIGGAAVAFAELGSGGGPVANHASNSRSVAIDQGLTPATGESAADLRAETALPTPYPPEILRVSWTPEAHATAKIYPPDVIDATTVYDVFDGTTGTTVWAGGIAGDPSTGVFLQTVGRMGSGEGPPQTLHLAGTGPITLTRFSGDDLFFTTASGQSGVYHIGTGVADVGPGRRNVRSGA